MLCSYNGLIANEQAQVDSQLLELWLAAIAIVFYRVLILVLEIGVDPYRVLVDHWITTVWS